MTEQELQRLKCYIVHKQYELLKVAYYGISCDKETLNADLNEALHIYYWYTTCPEEHCEITDFIKAKVNTCQLPFTDCPDTILIDCNALFIQDLNPISIPCNNITIQ